MWYGDGQVCIKGEGEEAVKLALTNSTLSPPKIKLDIKAKPVYFQYPCFVKPQHWYAPEVKLLQWVVILSHDKINVGHA